MSLLDILPHAELLLPFLIAGLALNLTPGSDMIFVALSGSRGGRTAGLAARQASLSGASGASCLPSSGCRH